MPSQPPPCCTNADAEHREDLGHVHQFDLDLYQCKRCSAYWVYTWRAGQGGWEPATADDAETMQRLGSAELRVFIKEWAKSFT